MLAQNYPNPFRPVTTIAYRLPEVSHVTLTVYGMTGQKVATMVSAHQQAGRYSVVWDAKDQPGRDVASAVYLYRLEVEELNVQTRRVVLLR